MNICMFSVLSPSPRSARRLELPRSVNLCNLVLFSSCWLVFTGESVSSCWSLWSLAFSWSLVRISSPLQSHFSITWLRNFHLFQDHTRSTAFRSVVFTNTSLLLPAPSWMSTRSPFLQLSTTNISVATVSVVSREPKVTSLPRRRR